MEVTKDAKKDDFTYKGPKKFTTCGIDCSKFPTCKNMNAAKTAASSSKDSGPDKKKGEEEEEKEVTI